MHIFIEHDKRGNIGAVAAATGETSKQQVAPRPRRGYSVAVIKIDEFDNLSADDLATQITALKRSHRVDTGHREARLVRRTADRPKRKTSRGAV